MEKIAKIDEDLMHLISQSNEVAIFNSKPVMDLIDYQWGVTGFNFHLVGFVNFFIYMIMLAVYVVSIYINDRLFEYKNQYTRVKIFEGPNRVAALLCIGLIYPTLYLLV